MKLKSEYAVGRGGAGRGVLVALLLVGVVMVLRSISHRYQRNHVYSLVVDNGGCRVSDFLTRQEGDETAGKTSERNVNFDYPGRPGHLRSWDWGSELRDVSYHASLDYYSEPCGILMCKLLIDGSIVQIHADPREVHCDWWEDIL